MKTVINIKADEAVKKDAQKIAETLGLSLSAVINAFLKQFVRNKEVHFAVAPRMSKKLERILKEVELDIQKKQNLSPVFSSAREMDKYLDSL
ncbi:MAG: type II toxin-antitoxin system RelB/DinJ family antitoxin [Candidatus Wildermuthbacteria bacterium]|nr:type II toxin-antitoxin system RelB/DinJ family antitoxin [Candidatus Wildermuthbacteria bacterium]